MIIEEYRNTTRIEMNNVNEEDIGVIDLSTGDVNGRIIVFAIWDGNTPVDPTGLTCVFAIDQQGGLYETMTPVTGEETATWEVAPSTSGLTPGLCDGVFRITASDNSVTETKRFKVRVNQGVFESGEEGTEMQSVLSDFEERTSTALNSLTAAVARANELIALIENVDVQTATNAANQAAARAEAAASAVAEFGKLGLSVVDGAINVTYLVEQES